MKHDVGDLVRSLADDKALAQPPARPEDRHGGALDWLCFGATFRTMRALVFLLVLSLPAQAWDFTATPVCTIFHDTPGLSIRVTFDPALAEPYGIALTRPEPWPDSPTFGLRFDGDAPLSIGTDRQRLSSDGRTLSVTDTGFGNVLDGLAGNVTATALAAGTAVPFDLTGAAPAVEAFRACGVAPLS